MEEQLLAKIKTDALNIITTKTEGIKMAKSIQDLIDNELCDVMSCPGCYGLKELNCQDANCKTCWQYAIAPEQIQN